MQIILLIILFVIIIFVIFNTLGFFTGAPYAPTPKKIIHQALKLAKVNRGDVVYDLGAGDGRVLIEAANMGATAVGWELNPFLYLLIYCRIQKLNTKAEIHLADFWSQDLSNATVVFAFILPQYMGRLEKKLFKKVKPGTKVITYLASLPYKQPTKRYSGLNLYQF